MNQFFEEYSDQFANVIEHLRSELSKLRAGVATPALIEHIKVDAYGTLTPIQQIASISIPDAKTILIQPWDKAVTKNIEKGIIDAGQNLNPVNEGEQIRIVIPPLMEETRKDMIKLLKNKAEKARISIRGLRDKVKENIITAEKNSEITEDDKFLYLKKLDTFTIQKNQEIKELAEKKEKAIMTV